MSDCDDTVFPGFPGLEGGYTQFPNAWFDILLQIDNLAELKSVFYVMRHTWGYRDEDGNRDVDKKISTDEFAYGRARKDGTRLDSGTNLALSSVKEGVKKATTHEYLLCEVDESDLARIKKYYRLKMKADAIFDSRNLATDSRKSDAGNLNSDTGNLDAGQGSWKETPEEKLLKETKGESTHTPSQFFKKTIEYLEKQKKPITFNKLEKFLRRFFRVRGEKTIVLIKFKNALVWDRMSQEFCDVWDELVRSNQIITDFSTQEAYQKARKPKMPVATQLADHKEQEWHPMVIRLKK